jgi:hypothetical protein
MKSKLVCKLINEQNQLAYGYTYANVKLSDKSRSRLLELQLPNGRVLKYDAKVVHLNADDMERSILDANEFACDVQFYWDLARNASDVSRLQLQRDRSLPGKYSLSAAV